MAKRVVRIPRALAVGVCQSNVTVLILDNPDSYDVGWGKYQRRRLPAGALSDGIRRRVYRQLHQANPPYPFKYPPLGARRTRRSAARISVPIAGTVRPDLHYADEGCP